MMPHSPGPWTVETIVCMSGQRIVSGQGGHIAIVRATPRQMANARLIAAAPDLLEACKSVFAGLQAKADSRRKWRISDQEDYDTLHIAIAKAEGN